MKYLLPILFAAVPLDAMALPAMVTTAKGNVHLLDGSEDKTAPAPPFLLQESQALDLADEAEVVLLYEGIASHLVGPRKVKITDLATGADESQDRGALEELLSKQVVMRRAAATRGSEAAISRPVPGTNLEKPHVIRWACEDCGEVEVKLYDFLNDKDLWSTRGSGEVRYDGPALPPGAYSVVIDGKNFSFTVPNEDVLAKVKAAKSAADAQVKKLRDAGLDNEAALTAVPATVYLQAGMPTDALYTIEAALEKHPDDPELAALLAEFERRAGLRKE